MSNVKKIVFLKCDEAGKDLTYFECNVVNAVHGYQVEVSEWGSTFDTAGKTYKPQVRFYGVDKHIVVIDLYSEDFDVYLKKKGGKGEEGVLND